MAKRPSKTHHQPNGQVFGQRLESLHRDQLTELFVRGQAARLLVHSESDFETAKSMDLLIASHVLRGDLEQAMAVAASREESDLTGMISFYLSLGLTRAGRYEEAKQKIKRLEKLKRNGLVEFYSQQAQGFLSFIRGEPSLSTQFARKSLIASEAVQHPLRPLARILSLDLLGHSLVQTGFLRSGIKTLRLAREASVRAGNENFNHAISISLLKYEAAFGIEPARIVSRLYRALIELKPDDSYSRSELRLELSRQLILRGQLRQARLQLEEAAGDILGSQNHQQTAALYMKQAWLARLEGRLADALLGLQTTESFLLAEADSDLRSKTRFFRFEVLQMLGELELSAKDRALKLVRSLKEQSDEAKLHGIERRMVLRKFGAELGSQPLFFGKGEDPFGDLMDRVHQRAQGVELELLQKRYFGLLLPILGLNFGQKAIVLGAPKGVVIVIEDGETRVSETGLGGILGRLISRLSEGPCARQEAIEQIWGYQYEAERHDRLLAVAVSRIRKALGGKQKWIEFQGDRLVFEDQVLIRYWSGAPRTSQVLKNIVVSAPTNKNTSPIFRPTGSNTTRLRIRQLQVLEDLATRGDVGVPDLVERFGISRSSALRDLNELVEMGLVIRTGDTRATRYMKP